MLGERQRSGDDQEQRRRASAKDQYTRITFERRFSPGAQPDKPALQAGELLLGGQVMALAIDGKGAVEHCQVVATSGR